MARSILFSLLCLLTIGRGAWAEVPRVATDIAPVHGLVARVMQGIGTPDLLVRPGASPHGYAMRPSEALALNQADFVFWVGEGLTPWLEGALATLSAEAQVVELSHITGGIRLAQRDSVNFSEQHHDEEEEGHDHDHESFDPHVWLAPENGKLWLAEIATELAGFDPDNAARYQANATAGQAEIDRMVEQLNVVLELFRATKFVVFHDAYQYFETSFGLTATGAISLSDASDPSPARILEIRDLVTELGVSCVFSEPQFNAGLVRTVLDGSGATTAVLDPMGVELSLGPQFYVDLLRNMGMQMAGCH